LQRAPLRHWLPLAIGAGIGALLLIAGGSGQSPPCGLAPVEQLLNLLHWLGAPFVWALSPLLDVAHAARAPGPFSTTLLAIASPIEAAFGPFLSARWPSTAIGAFAFAWLVRASWQTWRQRDSEANERFALGVAWFGCVVGMLVVTARLEYFRRHPDQVTTSRYVPWSMMCWTGLLLRCVLRDGRSTRTLVLLPVTAALLLLPSQLWTGRYMFRQQQTADQTAAGVAVGVIDRQFPLAETKERDLRRSVPLLREAGVAMFAWPETAWIDRHPEATTPVVIDEIEVKAVENIFDGAGSEVSFRADSAASRLVLLDGDGIARGLATRAGFDGRWRGWLRGTVPPSVLRACVLR
jgi:hypothetical protein